MDQTKDLAYHISKDKCLMRLFLRLNRSEIEKIYELLSLKVLNVLDILIQQYPEKMVDVNTYGCVIDLHTRCLKENVDFCSIVNSAKKLWIDRHNEKNIQGGSSSKVHTDKYSIITRKILEGIINRKFDKEKIDNNLRIGTKQRKEYLRRVMDANASKA